MAVGTDPSGWLEPSAYVVAVVASDGRHMVELSEVTRVLQAARADERAKVVARLSAWADEHSGPGGDVCYPDLLDELAAIDTEAGQ